MVSEDKQIWTPSLLFSEEHKILISPRYRKYPEEVTSLDIRDLKEDRFIVMPDISVFYSDMTYKLPGNPQVALREDADRLSSIRKSNLTQKIFCLTENLRCKPGQLA